MMRKQLSIVLTALLLSMFLISNLSFSTAYPSSEENVTALPDFLERLLTMLLPNANSSTLDRIRELWINQLALKRERVEVTNVAKSSSSQSLDYSVTGYITDVLRVEEVYYGTVTGSGNIVGYADDAFARLYAPYYNPYNEYERSHAAVVGELSNPYANGDVYVTAKLGPTGYGQNGNYIMVMGSNDPDASLEEWCEGFIGYAEITYPYNQPGSENAYIGYTENTYAYVTVGVVNMGGDCTYNDVMIDGITFSECTPPPGWLWIDALADWEFADTSVYVDSQYVCNTNYYYQIIPLSEGNHTIQVDNYAGVCPFRYFIYNDEDVEDNPITVYISPAQTTYLVAIYLS